MQFKFIFIAALAGIAGLGLVVILGLNELSLLLIIFILLLLVEAFIFLKLFFLCNILGVEGARFLTTSLDAGGEDKLGTDRGGVKGVGKEVERCRSGCRRGDCICCNGIRPKASKGCPLPAPAPAEETTPAEDPRNKWGSISILF